MKNENGITTITLIITIIIMVILAVAGINYGTSSYQVTAFQNFSYKLEQIQGRVDAIHEKMKLEDNTDYISLEGKTLGRNITVSSEAMETLNKVKRIDYGHASTEDKELYYNGSDTSYRYLTKSDMKNLLDIKNMDIDVIVNFKTREVISAKGYEYDGQTYYTLEEMK